MPKILSSVHPDPLPQTGEVTATATVADEDAARESSEGSAPALDDRSLYINREMSWLAFNERVLDRR